MERKNSSFFEAQKSGASSNYNRSGGVSGFFSRCLTPQNDDTVKTRKVPLKIEPKVFFANERTFLSWMHSATYLSAAAMGIIAYADDNPWSQVYGLTLLPVALGFIVYAMNQFLKRLNMIKVKHPGPYLDEKGPLVLTILLMISIIGNFTIKLYSIYSSGKF